MQQLSVLHVSAYDWGGAGNAALRVHRTMLENGVRSAMLVKDQRTISKGVFSPQQNQLVSKAKKLVEVGVRRLQYKEQYCVYSVADRGVNRLLETIDINGAEPSVVILHWIANFISLNDIACIKERFNCDIYWYAMDMAPFTGGCHYSWGCDGYTSGCQDCPAQIMPWTIDSPAEYFESKKRLVKRLDVTAIVPNKWVEKQIQLSAIPFESIEVCYLPLDSEVFSPGEDRYTTGKLDGSFKVFFGVQKLKDRRKGTDQFVKAMMCLKSQIESSADDLYHPVVVLPGLETGELDEMIPFTVERVPYATTEKALSRMYQQADVYVCTSVEDSGPMMVCESLMSGIPVVGFEMGICPELIEDGYNGSCVPLGDSAAVASALFEMMLLDNKSLERMGENARESVIGLMDTESHFGKMKAIINNVAN